MYNNNMKLEMESVLATFDYSLEPLKETLLREYLKNHNRFGTIATPKMEAHFSELLEVIFCQGRKTLEMLIRLLNEDAIYVFDFDGTLDAFKYAIGRLLPCRDDEIEEYCKTHDLYEFVYILKTLKYIISRLNKKNVYVLTRSELTVIRSKNKAILDNFDIAKKHIIHVQNADNKLSKLRKLHKKTGKKIFFVEDSFKTILNAEECMEFVEGIHISEFIS